MNRTSEAGQAIGSPLMQDNRPASGGNVKGEKENKLRKFTEENPAAGWVILHGNRIVRNFAKKIVKRSLAYAIINMSTGWKDAEKAIIGPVG